MVLSPEEKKERRKEHDRRYRERHKEKIAERKNEYMKEYSKKYDKTPAGIKRKTIYDWKRRGVITNDFDTLYDLYINTDKCMYCEKVFVDSVDRCLDHDHETGLYRAVLCRSCNVKDILNPKL